MEKKLPKNKFKRKIIILRSIGFLCIAFQLLGYIGSAHTDREEMDIPETIGYFIGYNFFLWIAIVFFYRSFKVSEEAKKANATSVIDAIGKGESTI